MKPVYNPYLPFWEFVPDGEPHVFNGRLYIYGSHDRYGSENYCMDPYTVWSAPLNDLSSWICHGIVYTGEGDPHNSTGCMRLFAPDAAEKNGKYYLYYGLETSDIISVAIAGQPEGPFRFYGHVHYPDGTIWGQKEGDRNCFDPGIFVDEDGRVYLYSGFSVTEDIRNRIESSIQENSGQQVSFLTSEGSLGVELEEDMLTIKNGPFPIIPGEGNSAGTGFEGHEFFEASSMRKIQGKYCAVYSSVNGHELCYALSDEPLGGFEYGGVLHSNGNIFRTDSAEEEASCYYGNNHGSIAEINGEYYVFGHRHTGFSQYQRQGVAEKLTMTGDGRFNQAEMTSYGLGRPFRLPARLPAWCACILKSKNGAFRSSANLKKTGDHPAIVLKNGVSCISNLKEGSVAGFRDLNLPEETMVCIRLTYRCSMPMKAEISFEESSRKTFAKSAEGFLKTSDDWSISEITAQIPEGVHPLLIRFQGEGSADLLEVLVEAL